MKVRLPVVRLLWHLAVLIAVVLCWAFGLTGDMWFQAFYVVSAIVAGASFIAVRPRPHLFHWFVGCYVPMFYVYPAIAPFADLPVPDSASILRSYLLLSVGGLHVFCLAFEVRWAMWGSNRPNTISDLYSVPLDRVRTVFYAGFIVNMIAVLLLIVDAHSVTSLWSGSRVERKLAMGPLSLASIYLLTIGSVQYLCLARFAGRRLLILALWGVFFSGIEAVLFLALRARTIFVLHSVAFLYGWFILGRPRSGALVRGRGWGQRLWAGLRVLTAGMVIFLVAAQLRVSRGFIGTDEFTASLRQVTDAFQLSIGSGELGYASVVLELLQIVPDRESYLYGQSYYRVLMAVIPRSWWPGKPLSTERIVGYWLNPTAEEMTSPAGIIGDVYINFGLCGIAMMLVYGWIFASLGVRRGLADSILIGTSFPIVFHFVRGAVTSPVLLGAVLWIGSGVLARYLQTGEVGLPLLGGAPVRRSGVARNRSAEDGRYKHPMASAAAEVRPSRVRTQTGRLSRYRLHRG